MLANRVARAGYRTTDNNVAVHLVILVCLTIGSILVWVMDKIISISPLRRQKKGRAKARPLLSFSST